MVAVVDAFHIDLTAAHFIGQGVFQQVFDFDVSNWAAFDSQQVVLFINLAPIDNLAKFFLENAIQPNTSAGPFPSLKGWAIFISTYFSTISSKVDCGILSMFSSAASRYIKGAKRKLPFARLTVLSLPAKS